MNATLVPSSPSPRPPWDALARFLFAFTCVLVVGHLALAAALLLSGCAVFGREEPPACRPEELGKIEARFAAEAVQRCRGYATFAACPAHDELAEKYAREREEWVACR